MLASRPGPVAVRLKVLAQPVDAGLVVGAAKESAVLRPALATVPAGVITGATSCAAPIVQRRVIEQIAAPATVADGRGRARRRSTRGAIRTRGHLDPLLL
jgi:hypothetical protein